MKGIRNPSSKRSPQDYYPTPAWVLEHLPISADGYSVLDPCAGDGSLLRALCDTQVPREVLGIELDEKRAEQAGCVCGDALAMDWPAAELVVTNPPFSLAAEFVERALAFMRKSDRTGAHAACFLLPLSWLEPAKTRAHLLRELDRVHVLPRRPSFTGDGKCAASAYAWFLWWAQPIEGTRISFA